MIRPTMLPTDGPGTSFPVDLHEREDAFVLKASVPGVRPEDVDAHATAEGVSIKAEVKHDAEINRENWLLQERRYGTLQRSFALPTQIDPNKVEARFENGVLTFTLPKAEAVRPKQIKVQAPGAAVAVQSR